MSYKLGLSSKFFPIVLISFAIIILIIMLLLVGNDRQQEYNVYVGKCGQDIILESSKEFCKCGGLNGEYYIKLKEESK